MFRFGAFLEFGQSCLQITDYLERSFRVHSVVRDRLSYDTQFALPAPNSDRVNLLFIVAGSIDLAGEARKVPAALVLPADAFELGMKSRRYLRSYGRQVRLVDLRLTPAGLGPCLLATERDQFDVSPRAWALVERLLDSIGEDASRTVLEFLEALVQEGVLAPSVPRSIVAEEPERFVRLVEALAPRVNAYEALMSAQELADATGLSIRQLGRDLTAFVKAFGLIGDSYRDVLLRVRLRTAVLLLSSPGTTALEVAQRMGYGSMSALTRAFRNSGLPTPQEVEARLKLLPT